jgi:hypothetical protein
MLMNRLLNFLNSSFLVRFSSIGISIRLINLRSVRSSVLKSLKDQEKLSYLTPGFDQLTRAGGMAYLFAQSANRANGTCKRLPLKKEKKRVALHRGMLRISRRKLMAIF